MNIFSKIFYRTIHFSFYLIKPFLPYKPPKILENISDITVELMKKNIKNVMLVSDKMVRNIGLTKSLEENLIKSNINLIIYENVDPNPTSRNVEEGLALYNKENCEAIIAFGGGSPIDCAKAIGARIVKPKKSLRKLKGILKVGKRLPPLFCVPTTAGTGSETTITSVISDSETHEKFTINDFKLVPEYAVLDPITTFTLPKHLTSTTGLDALTHAIEAYIGKSTTKTTRKQAIEAIKLIFDNIVTAYNEPKNYAARKNMLMASHIAGKAFSMSYVGYVHAVAHSLGGKYNTPHGLANSVLLPIFLKEYGKTIYKKISKISIALGLVSKTESQEIAFNTFMNKLDEIYKKLDIPKTINAIKEEDIPSMAKTAAKEANHIYPVPVLLTAKELEKFYKIVGGLQ